VNAESESVEFKPSLSQIRDIVESVSAFSTTKGGRIEIGKDDNGMITGVAIGKRTVENLANDIKQNTDPPVFPSIRVEKRGEKDVIVIEISESETKPVLAYGRAFKRVGKTNHKLGYEEIRKLAMQSSKFYWDEQICEGATLNDIDDEKVKSYLRKARSERNLDVDPENPIKESLKRLSLLTEKGLTNAAVLMFGREPQKFFIQARIRCARFKGKNAVDFIDTKLIDGNIVDQVDAAERFVLSHIKKAAKIVMMKREEVWEYPPAALREAIVNAVCHRDYESPGNVKIAVFDDGIEITSPGSLPEPLTPEMLKTDHDSIPRNKLIANAFFMIRNIEQWGKGTNKIVKWCVDHGLKEPDFKEIGGGFEVVFYAPEDVLKLVPEKEKIDLKEIGLNERQIECLRLMVNEGRRLTNREYRRILKITNKTAATDLALLVKKGLIQKKGKGRSVEYVGG